MQKKLKRGEEDSGVENLCRRNSKEAKKIGGGGRKSIQKKLKRAEDDLGVKDPCRRN